jgi:hypothetical protein
MTTYISTFSRLILGRNAPAVLDVEKDAASETIVASFHNFKTLKQSSNGHEENTRAEFRGKGNEFALFLFQYPDSELPDWWKDSKLIWSSEEENAQEDRKENWKKLFDTLDSGEFTADDIDQALRNVAEKHSLK